MPCPPMRQHNLSSLTTHPAPLLSPLPLPLPGAPISVSASLAFLFCFLPSKLRLGPLPPLQSQIQNFKFEISRPALLPRPAIRHRSLRPPPRIIQQQRHIRR